MNLLPQEKIADTRALTVILVLDHFSIPIMYLVRIHSKHTQYQQ